MPAKQKDVRKLEKQDSSDPESEELDDPINLVTVSLHATSSTKSTPPIMVNVQLFSWYGGRYWCQYVPHL